MKKTYLLAAMLMVSGFVCAQDDPTVMTINGQPRFAFGI